MAGKILRPLRDVFLGDAAAVVGHEEAKGPLGDAFDLHDPKDDTFGKDTWEKAESEMQRLAVNTLLAKRGLTPEEIDWLFAPFPYVGLRTTRKRLTEYLHIRNVFAFHQPRPEMDGQNWIGSTRRVCELAQDSLPKPIFPGTLGEWYEI